MVGNRLDTTARARYIRTSELRSRIHVKRNENWGHRIRDANGRYGETLRAPARVDTACTRSGSRQDGGIAPCEVSRAHGYPRALIELLCQTAIGRRILGGDLDETVCECLDSARELTVLGGIRWIGARGNAGCELTEKAKRDACHID